VLLLGVVTWPLLFTDSGFFDDWKHHLWLMWHESLAIQANHVPSYFLNSAYSVFNPTFAFYGGTLYALAGTLSVAVGGAPVEVYVLVFVLDFAAAFGGWYWLARMMGVNRWLALVPGLIFITSSYYIAIAYVQGDWPEFTGLSMIPLMVASGISVLLADRTRWGPTFALLVSSILFFGSHNITIMLGLTTLALTALAILAIVPDARRRVTRWGIARTAGIVVPAAMVSAWYLLPLLAYQSRTHEGRNYAESLETLKATTGMVSAAHLFTLSRANAGTPNPNPWVIPLSLPILAIIWVLASIIIVSWGGSRTWKRTLLICSTMTILITVVMTHVGVLLALPRQYSFVQFTYRIEAYVLLALCAAVLAALVLARSGSRRARIWTWMAIPICAVSLVGAIQQMNAFPYSGVYAGTGRYTVLDHPGEIETGNNQDFQDDSEPIVNARNLPKVSIAASEVRDDRVSWRMNLRPGALMATDIATGPYLVHITGAKAVGIDSENHYLVLAMGPGSGSRPITVSTASGLPIVLGRLLSLVGFAILTLELVLLSTYRGLSKRMLSRRMRAPARA
jgi:uncharacterized membrane protein